MQGKFSSTVLLVLLGVMIHLPYGRMQRSPYVPMPVNLPGLLPRFGEVDDNSAAGQAAQSSSSSSGGDTMFSGGDFGGRIGEDVTTRIPPPRGGSTRPSQQRCPPQQVPCYDCMVYISRSGQITKFSPEGRRL